MTPAIATAAKPRKRRRVARAAQPALAASALAAGIALATQGQWWAATGALAVSALLSIPRRWTRRAKS